MENNKVEIIINAFTKLLQDYVQLIKIEFSKFNLTESIDSGKANYTPILAEKWIITLFTKLV